MESQTMNSTLLRPEIDSDLAGMLPTCIIPALECVGFTVADYLPAVRRTL
jgi:hypothetical protein